MDGGRGGTGPFLTMNDGHNIGGKKVERMRATDGRGHEQLQKIAPLISDVYKIVGPFDNPSHHRPTIWGTLHISLWTL